MSVDVKLINAFLESLLHVLYTMAQTEAEHKTPTLKTDSIAKGDVSGMINMKGSEITGTIAISFSEDTILEIAKRMIGVELRAIDDTINDLVGEITNMVTGGAKQILIDAGHVFDMSQPQVFAGKKHQIEHQIDDRVIHVPFQSSSGIFYAEFSFQNNV